MQLLLTTIAPHLWLIVVYVSSSMPNHLWPIVVLYQFYISFYNLPPLPAQWHSICDVRRWSHGKWRRKMLVGYTMNDSTSGGCRRRLCGGYGRSREQRHQNHSAYSSTRFNAICDERRRPHRKRRKRMLMGDTINYSTSGGRRQWRWEYGMGRRSGDRALPSSLINRPVDASYLRRNATIPR